MGVPTINGQIPSEIRKSKVDGPKFESETFFELVIADLWQIKVEISGCFNSGTRFVFQKCRFQVNAAKEGFSKVFPILNIVKS